jgi:hypothetical protein
VTPKQALRLAEQRLLRKVRDREAAFDSIDDCQAPWTAVPVEVWRQIFDAEPGEVVEVDPRTLN